MFYPSFSPSSPNTASLFVTIFLLMSNVPFIFAQNSTSNFALSLRTSQCVLRREDSIIIYGGKGPVSTSNFSTIPVANVAKSSNSNSINLPTKDNILVADAACSIMSDENLFVVGGEPVNKNQIAKAGFQTFDFTNKTWLPSDPGGVPNDYLRGRIGIITASFINQDLLFVHGGALNGQVGNKTWIFNYTNGLWLPIRTSLPPLAFAGTIQAGNKVYLFGGQSQNRPTSDIWSFDFNSKIATKQSQSLSQPVSFARAVNFGNNVTVFSSVNGVIQAEQFILKDNNPSDTSTSMVIKSSLSNKSQKNVITIPARIGFSVIDDLPHQEIFIVGGTSPTDGSIINDIAIYDPLSQSFTQGAQSSPQPSPQSQSIPPSPISTSPSMANSSPIQSSSPTSTSLTPNLLPSTAPASGIFKTLSPTIFVVILVVAFILLAAAVLVIFICISKRRQTKRNIQPGGSSSNDPNTLANINSNDSRNPYTFAQNLLRRVSRIIHTSQDKLPKIDATPFPDEKLRQTLLTDSSQRSRSPSEPAGMSFLRVSYSEFPMPPEPSSALIRIPQTRMGKVDVQNRRGTIISQNVSIYDNFSDRQNNIRYGNVVPDLRSSFESSNRSSGAWSMITPENEQDNPISNFPPAPTRRRRRISSTYDDTSRSSETSLVSAFENESNNDQIQISVRELSLISGRHISGISDLSEYSAITSHSKDEMTEKNRKRLASIHFVSVPPPRGKEGWV